MSRGALVTTDRGSHALGLMLEADAIITVRRTGIVRRVWDHPAFVTPVPGTMMVGLPLGTNWPRTLGVLYRRAMASVFHFRESFPFTYELESPDRSELLVRTTIAMPARDGCVFAVWHRGTRKGQLALELDG